MTLDLSLVPDGGIAWADASGPDGHIVLSSRIRLARNLQGMPFTIRADQAEHEVVLSHVLSAARQTPDLADAPVLRVDGLDRGERQLLHERHLISRELAALDQNGPGRPGAALVLHGDLGLMINEEDHLRLQSFRSGFALPEAYASLERLDTSLGQRLAFAFHPEFGYLTACPTNAGTGLRASVLIHLPGLVLTKEIAKVLQGLSQVGLTFRGLYGEGSEVVGNFFQLSNQTTLGKSEEDLLDQLVKIVRQVIEYEEEARRVLQRDAPALIEDKIWRAYGLLRHARLLSFEEAMNLLSGVRLGVGLNLITDVGVYTLNKLMIFTQPAHLAHQAGRVLTDPDLPALRAGFVRSLLEDDMRRRAGGA
ncbi:MAG: protein arginine kinase [Gemmatimonadetes bacterium RBG_16_66_8]|nr:MAG: protein arginine kinase [Gemmatimonadetes bacterium RBG_16_66_8]